MSIDFETSVTSDFTVASLVETTTKYLRRIVGPDTAGELETRFRPYREPGTPVLKDRFHSWSIGTGHPEASIELAQEPNVLVTIDSSADDDDLLDAYVQSTAEFRTASSVLVAIAVILAANELGAGVFTKGVATLFDRKVDDPMELRELLRRESKSGEDLESASREVLRKTAGFSSWNVVTDHIRNDVPRPSRTER